MRINVFLVLCSMLVCHVGFGQDPPSAVSDSQSLVALHEIGRGVPWSRIGSPPSQQALASRVEQWRQESAAYARAFSLLKQSWTGEAVDNPGDLRFRVRQYEDFIQNVTDVGGYGNVVLADSARRLSLGMIGRYAVTHPQEYATIGDLLAEVRVRLLDCPATSDMIADELRLAAPSGSWHLSEKQEELRLVFRSDGSDFHNAAGRSLLGVLTPSSMMGKRDVSGLLHRLTEDEMMARCILPAMVEFLKRGGSLANLESFNKVMQDQGTRFAFPPLGERRIFADNIQALVTVFRKWNGQAMPFRALVGE
jgi:hypothetical protein